MEQKIRTPAGKRMPPEMPRRAPAPPEEPAISRYYQKVSARFKLLKYLSLLSLVVAVLWTVTVYRDYITYDNLRYLLRDLDEAIRSDGGGVVSTIRYDADGNRSFALYRGNLAVAGESKVTIYKASGRQLLSRTFVGSQPVLLGSDKYLLAYDFGGYQFAVFNALAELHRKTLDYPISGAVVADNGAFAILTQTLEHRSAVFLYNSKFELVGKYLKDKYVIDLQLKKDGSELLLVSFFAEGGDYVTEIAGYTPKDTAEKFKIECRGAFPLKAGYFADGGFCVVDDGAIRFFDGAGQAVSAYDYSFLSFFSVEIGERGVAAVFNKNVVGGENSAVLFDTKGNIRYNNNIIGDTCVDLQFWGDYVYMLTDTEVIRLSPDDGSMSVISVENGARRLLVYDERTVLLCYPGRAQTVRLEG